MIKILKKARVGVLCGGCGTVLVSWHRHDFVGCTCNNNAFVDGGLDYLRYGSEGQNPIQLVKVSNISKRKVSKC